MGVNPKRKSKGEFEGKTKVPLPVQVDELDAPVLGVVLPAGQREQLALLPPGEKVPVGHVQQFRPPKPGRHTGNGIGMGIEFMKTRGAQNLLAPIPAGVPLS